LKVSSRRFLEKTIQTLASPRKYVIRLTSIGSETDQPQPKIKKNNVEEQNDEDEDGKSTNTESSSGAVHVTFKVTKRGKARGSSNNKPVTTTTTSKQQNSNSSQKDASKC